MAEKYVKNVVDIWLIQVHLKSKIKIQL